MSAADAPRDFYRELDALRQQVIERYSKLGTVMTTWPIHPDGAPKRLGAAVDLPEKMGHRAAVDPHERAVSVWYRVTGLLRKKGPAIEIIEAEIRSAQREVWLEASRLVLSMSQPVEIARTMRDKADRLIRPE